LSFDLTKARLNEGLSIRGLAKEVNVPEHSIRRYESGEGGLHPGNAKRIADRFGVKVTDLLPLGQEAA
jgi:ribosome-binding protein aMBF1 (putative translation factor)